MNIAVYFPQTLPTVGGGFTTENTLLQALLIYKTLHHNFYIFSHNGITQTIDSNLTLINITEKKPKGTQKFKREWLRILRQFRLAPPNQGHFIATLKQYPIDIVWFPSPLTTKDTAGIPYISTVWDLGHRIHPYFPELINAWDYRENHYRHFLPKASYIIAGNEAGKDDISFFYQIFPNRIKAIPIPYPDLSSITATPIATLKKAHNFHSPYLYCPAMFWCHKSQYRILEALKILKETHQQTFYLVLTGHDTGNLHYIKEKTIQMGLTYQVAFLGFVDAATKVSLYQNAHATICTSYIGPSCIPGLESLSLGCPFICSRYPGAECEFKNTALYFDLDNPYQLAEHILNLQNNPDLRASLLEKNRIFAFLEPHKPINYIKSILTIVDNFQKIRNCWGKAYQEKQ